MVVWLTLCKVTDYFVLVIN
uniref:Uncharacterized protein n=1 Tax=Anguilla anguilla TaxID=7936 RepID=A0A0E9XAD9_ANGAN